MPANDCLPANNGVPEATRPDWRLLGGFAAASLITIGLGAATMASHDVAAVRWLVNLGGWAIGGILACAIVRLRLGARALRVIIVAGTLLLLASLAGPGLLGVHRWLAFGPLMVNAAALALPAVIVVIARLGHCDRISRIFALVIAAVLAWQPDASQGIAFTAAILLVSWPAEDWRSMGLWAGLILTAGIAAIRPDPLLPVPEVEQIVRLAWRLSPLLAAAMVLALAVTVASLLLPRHDDRAARALTSYAAVVVLAPFFGWFPMPLAGSGVSFVIGFWLGAAILAMPSRNGLPRRVVT